MSYSMINTCGSCTKQEGCKDAAEVQKAIGILHQMTPLGGHLGSGHIIILCNNMEKPQPQAPAEQPVEEPAVETTPTETPVEPQPEATV